MAATALSGAAFLLARKWKALLLVAILAGAGILLYSYWTDRVAERRTQKIHDCAVAKVATSNCTTPNEFGFMMCEDYGYSPAEGQTADAAIATAEKECTAEMGPKQKSAHDEIEEYNLSTG
jgi:hypothetical protein